MAKLIISDIDGTLLPAGKTEIPERVLHALQAAIDQGIEVVIASGRMYSDIPEELKSLRGLRYVITCNGASIYDRQEERVIFDCKIPAGQAADILRRLTSYHCYGCIYLPEGVNNWKERPEGLDELYPMRREFFRRAPHEDLAAWVEDHEKAAEKIFIAVLEREERDQIRRVLSKLPGIHVTSSSPKNLEVNHIQADKGSALAWLCRHLDISPADVIAMGDNENDYNMLSLAGTAVAPANAVEVILDLATVVTPACKQCGMAIYMEEHVLRSKEEPKTWQQ